MLTVQLADDHIRLNDKLLRPRTWQPADFTHALGPPDRIQPMYHRGEFVNTLHIYDQLGLRFWSKGERVGELQLVLETGAAEIWPAQAFAGSLSYQGHPLSLPVPGSLLTESKLPGFVQDTDVLRYNLVVFEATLPSLRYSATLGRQSGNIANISVS